MNPGRLFYRTHQFWQALSVRPTQGELEQALSLLAPAQKVLFLRLQPSEQAHSLRVLRRLVEQGESHPDLLAAALLHDVGKIRFPLRLWERVWIVLAFRWYPAWAQARSALDLRGDPSCPAWQKALEVAGQHARWGADLAAQCGSSALLVEIIRRHQDLISAQPQSLAEHLLYKLQSVDNES